GLLSRTDTSAENLYKSLELELQSKLRQARVTDVQHLAKRASLVGNVAVHGIELSMIPNVEEIRAEFHLQTLAEFGLFREAHVPVVEARAAAERARSIADRPRRDSSIRHQVRIKGITGNRLASRQSGIDGLRQGTGKGSAYRAARVDCFEDGPGS